MVEPNIVLAENDLRALERLDAFLPKKIFDMHMHVADRSFRPKAFESGSIWSQCGDNKTVTMDTYRRQMGALFGTDRLLRSNMIVTPEVSMHDTPNGTRRAAVEFLVEQLEQNPLNVGEIPVLAGDTREQIEEFLVHPRIRGFKCYHATTGRADSWHCEIGEYLPETAWQVAEDRGMCITLHMVRDLALADEKNMDYICRMAQKYPNARLILAHAGRSFAAWTAMESVHKLEPYANVCFDLSAVCESPASFEIIQTVGLKRVFWGSDYPVSMYRGKCVSLGETFLWLYREQLELCQSKTNFSAYLVGVENLLAMREACRMLKLDRKAVEDLFYYNALEFFGLEDE